MTDEEASRDLVNAASVVRKIEALTHLQERQRETISEIVNEALALDGRVRTLESLAQMRAIAEAREDERDKALYSRLDKIERKVDALDGIDDKVDSIGKDVDSIKGNFSKAAWVIGTSVIGAIALFILKGGLTI